MATIAAAFTVAAVYRAYMSETYISDDFKAEVVNDKGKIVAVFYGTDEDELRAEAEYYCLLRNARPRA